MSLNAKTWHLAAKISCLFCIILMFVSAGFAFFRWNFVRKAITTEAKITHLVESEGDTGPALRTPVYAFTDQNGETVTIASASPTFPTARNPGGTIEILYDPRNPTHLIENHFFPLWGPSVILGGLAVFHFLVFAAVAILTGYHLGNNGLQRA